MCVPKLWSETVEAHRRDVHTAILDTTWELARERGLLSVTMSQIAAQVGIGRATLYKYFSGVEAILIAHHERHVAGHLAHLAELANGDESPLERLEAVLEAYAFICHYRGKHGTEELGALVHRGEPVASAQRQLLDLFQGLLAEVTTAGAIRDDTAPVELAAYCLHALTAAAESGSEPAVRRLVALTLDGLR